MPRSNSFAGSFPWPGLSGLSLLIAIAALPVPSIAFAQQEAQEGFLKPFAAAMAPVPAETARNGSVYVPAYAQLPVGVGTFNVDLSVTLSIRNTSPDKVMVVRKIDHFDTSGAVLQSYLTSPFGLRPYGTVNLFISFTDRRGGSGGNFVVDWGGDAAISEPVIEAIMLGEFGGRAYSVVSRGVETTRPAQPPRQ
jgi:hypothetical protein